MLNELRTELDPSNPAREKSYRFALDVIRLNQVLVAGRNFEIARQLIRSGTSIGANVEEAQAAQSHRDFTAKMSIASKEARECHYWLRLIRDADLVPREQVVPLMAKARDLTGLLTSIVKTSQTR